MGVLYVGARREGAICIMKMLSLNELRLLMGISESTIFRLRKNNTPPLDKAKKVGGRVLIPEFAYNEWVRSSEACREVILEA
jgi:predicted DNA-binding transcriptional regulator AlpA